MKFPYKAVLFDMDGTITDSTAFHDAAWDEFALEHLGKGLEAGDPRLVPGRTIDIVRAVLGRHVEGEEADRLHDDKELRFHKLARGKMSTIAGLWAYLDWLKAKGIPAALVTNAPQINIDFQLPELGLDKAFVFTIGAEDVKQGKPHPDPYLEACQRLGVAPEEALVHEDSRLGIAAGVAAGCDVSAILTELEAATALVLGARYTALNFEDWLDQLQRD